MVSIKNWPSECLMAKHNLIGKERIDFFVYKLDDENNDDYKLKCDRCLERKSVKAKTEKNTIWCSDCLPPYDKWVEEIAKKNNSVEGIEKVLRKIREVANNVILYK